MGVLMKKRHSIFIFVLLFQLPCLCVTARIHYVHPYEDNGIETALNQAAEGDTIILENGFYSDIIDVQVPNLTIASRYLLDHDQRHIEETVWFTGTAYSMILAEGPRLERITITGISFTGESNEAYSLPLISDSVDVVMTHNRFAGCSGGVLHGSNGSLRFEHNVAENCASGSNWRVIRFYYVKEGRITDNRFLNNRTGNIWGGVLQLYEQSPGGEKSWLILNNDFIKNSAREAGAISLWGLSEVEIAYNRFIENVAIDQSGHSAAGAIGLHPEVENCIIHHNLFDGNSSTMQGGAIVFGSGAEVHHNVFINNNSRTSSVFCTQIINGYRHFIVNFYRNLVAMNFDNDPVATWYASIRTYPETRVNVFENDFIDNHDMAMGQDPSFRGYQTSVNNYWGNPSGPYHATQNPEGLGDTVMVNINILPFSTEQFTRYRRPDPFSLIAPEHEATIEGESVQFTWHSTTDPEPQDRVEKYVLEYALDWDFRDEYQAVDASTDTSLSLESENLPEEFWWRVVAYDTLGISRRSDGPRRLQVIPEATGLLGAEEVAGSGLPTGWAIRDAWPNPFNSELRIAVDVPETAPAIVEIYDVLGRKVTTLADQTFSRGRHEQLWDASDQAGGIYFIRLQANGMAAPLKRVVLIR